LVTFTYGKDETHVLARDPTAFRMAVGLAHGLYGLVRTMDGKIRDGGLGVLNDIGSVSFGPLSLSSLMPGPYRVGEIMRSGKVLREKEGESGRWE